MRTHGSPLRVIATEYDTGDNVGDGFALRSAPPPPHMHFKRIWCSQHAICIDLPTCWKPTLSFYPGDFLADVSSLVCLPVLYRCCMPHFTEKRA